MNTEGQEDDDATHGSARPTIVRDDGPATSRAQRTVVQREDRSEFAAHVKFAKDKAGAVLAEYGERGLASELLAAKLAELVDAPTPRVEVVELKADGDVKLSGGQRPAPGLAVASHTIESATDVNASTALDGIDPKELVALAVFHAWCEVGDRGHNLLRSRGHAYSIDHSTAFGSAWDAAEPPGTFAPDVLLGPRITTHTSVLREAAKTLAAVTDEAIASAVDVVPREFVPSDDVRDRLKRNISKSRDLVSANVLKEYPESEEQR